MMWTETSPETCHGIRLAVHFQTTFTQSAHFSNLRMATKTTNHRWTLHFRSKLKVQPSDQSAKRHNMAHCQWSPNDCWPHIFLTPYIAPNHCYGHAALPESRRWQRDRLAASTSGLGLSRTCRHHWSGVRLPSTHRQALGETYNLQKERDGRVTKSRRSRWDSWDIVDIKKKKIKKKP